MRNNTLCPCFHNFTVAVAIKTPTSASPHSRTELGNFRGGLRIMAPKCRAHSHYSGQNYKCTQKRFKRNTVTIFPHYTIATLHGNTIEQCKVVFHCKKNTFTKVIKRSDPYNTGRLHSTWTFSAQYNFTLTLHMTIGINNYVRTMCV